MYALVLAGGGAKGAFQIGVWRALNELDIEVGLVCGTSVGALNGALFAQKHYEDAENMWSHINMSQVFDAEESLIKDIDKIAHGGIFKTNTSMIKNLYNHVTKAKGLNVDPLRKMVDELLDEDVLRNSGIEFGLVTLSVNDRKPLKIFASEIPKGDLKYYLLGSALVPGFNQDESHHMKFIDGGVYDNFPIKMAIEKGYTDIIGVQLFERKKPHYKDINLTYIKPSENLGNFLYFDQEKSMKNMEMGYLDAMKAFGKLSGIDFYFTNIPNEDALTEKIIKISSEDRKKISTYFGYNKDITNRFLLEKVIPKIQSKLSTRDKNSYEDLAIGALEHLLRSDNFDRVKSYDYMEIAVVISSKLYPKKSLEEILQIIVKK